VYELKAQGKGVTDIAKEMNIARSSVYRALKERREKGLRQGSERPRQIPDGSKRRERSLLQPGESAPQLYEGELLKVGSERTIKQYVVRQDSIFSPDSSASDRLSRREKEESYETFRFESALTS
jgi:hypothetical protein